MVKLTYYSIIYLRVSLFFAQYEHVYVWQLTRLSLFCILLYIHFLFSIPTERGKRRYHERHKLWWRCLGNSRRGTVAIEKIDDSALLYSLHLSFYRLYWIEMRDKTIFDNMIYRIKIARFDGIWMSVHLSIWSLFYSLLTLDLLLKCCLKYSTKFNISEGEEGKTARQHYSYIALSQWYLFFLSSWGINRSAGQTNRVTPWTQKIRHSFLIFTMGYFTWN